MARQAPYLTGLQAPTPAPTRRLPYSLCHMGQRVQTPYRRSQAVATDRAVVTGSLEQIAVGGQVSDWELKAPANVEQIATRILR